MEHSLNGDTWDQMLSAFFTGASWDCPGGAQPHDDRLNGSTEAPLKTGAESNICPSVSQHPDITKTLPYPSPLCFKCLILTQVSKPSCKLNQNTFFSHLEKSEDTQRESLTSQSHIANQKCGQDQNPGIPAFKNQDFSSIFAGSQMRSLLGLRFFTEWLLPSLEPVLC